MAITVTKVLNYARLRRKLRRMPEAVKLRSRDAMGKAADTIVGMMKSLVQVDDGDLKKSIGWTWGKAPKGAFSIAEVKSSEFTLTIYAGDAEAFYARWVEFGTAPHKIKSKGPWPMGRDGRFGMSVDHPGARKQPFFYPSWRANRKATKAAMRSAIRKAMKEIARSG